MNQFKTLVPRLLWGTVVVAAFVGGLLAGCNTSKAEEGRMHQNSGDVNQKQTADVQNSANMSPAAKEATMRAMQQSQAAGAGMRAAATKAQHK